MWIASFPGLSGLAAKGVWKVLWQQFFMPTTGRSRVSSSSEHSELPHELRALSHRKLRNRHWYRCTLCVCVCEGRGVRGEGEMWDMRICMLQCMCNMYICIMCEYIHDVSVYMCRVCVCGHVQCVCVCVCGHVQSVCMCSVYVCSVYVCVMGQGDRIYKHSCNQNICVHLQGQTHSSILCVCVLCTSPLCGCMCVVPRCMHVCGTVESF